MNNPKLAYIDYSTAGSQMVIELWERNLEIAGAESLDDFLTRNDMQDYPVLLFHPGVNQQHQLRELPERFPHLKIAIVTSPTSGGEYLNLGSIVFGYNHLDAIEKWVRENQ